MLTYHQAFDIYHTAFRIIRILNVNPGFAFETDRLRIFDFLTLFPHELQNVQLPAGASSYKYKFKETKYNALPNRQRVFIQLGKYFNSSLSCLLSYEIIDFSEYKNDKILLTVNDKSKALYMSFGNESGRAMEIESFLNEFFLKMNLTELKKRTGLMEYRYDIFESK